MKEFIDKLKKLNLFLVVKNNNLVLKGREGMLSDNEKEKIKKDGAIINFIKQHKVELIEYLNSKPTLQSIYKLSPLQTGLLFHGIYDGNSNTYIEQFTCDFPAGVDIAVLKYCWGHLMDKHSTLRTGFIYDEIKTPVQCVFDNVNMPYQEFDFSDFPSEEIKAKTQDFLTKDRHTGFDLSTAPLMRITMIKTGDDSYKMVWTHHHIILDGWSVSILMAEFMNLYEILINNGDLPKYNNDEYKAYINYIDSRDKHKEELFWKNYVSNIDRPTLLPFSKLTRLHNKGAGKLGILSLNYDEEQVSKIREYVSSNRITINTLFQGVWAFLLSKYTNSNDVVFGAVVSGRPDDLPQIEEKVGLYINTLPLRIKLAYSRGVTDWLKELQSFNLQLREYQYTALNQIQKWSNVKENWFDSILAFENYPVAEAMSKQESGLKVKDINVSEQNNYILSLTASAGRFICLDFRFDSVLLDVEYVEMIKKHFDQVLWQMVNQNKKTLTLKEVQLITDEEYHRLLFKWNDTTKPFPRTSTILDLFRNQVNQNPDRIAVQFHDSQLTYRELEEYSNGLAHYIIEKYNIRTGDTVGVLMNRCEWAIVSIIGILKTGACYVPIAPDYPMERKSYIAQDTGLKVLITLSDYLFEVTSLKLDVVCIDIQVAEINQRKTPRPNVTISPFDPVYIMYTSGSTGNPKGVTVHHQNIVRLIYNSSFDFLGSSTVLYQYAPLSFDASTFEIWAPLLHGGTIVVSNQEDVTLEGMAQTIKANAVNTLWLTSGLFHTAVDNHIELFQTIKYALAGGDSIRPESIEKLLAYNSNLVFYNGYGPTEGTTFSVVNRISNLSELSKDADVVGKPIDNTQAYVLDAEGCLLPSGVPGELYIGGEGLAIGYLNDPTLTHQKFNNISFKTGDVKRLYQTGDMARWGLNGKLEFLGREDNQVKLRGFRVELGEIDGALQNHPSVNRCIVQCVPSKSGEKTLVAYLIPNSEYKEDEIVKYLEESLPRYMLPSSFVTMDSFPLTANQKIDKEALPLPEELSRPDNGYVAPTTAEEKHLVSIWMALLGKDHLGVKDSFFSVGGDSILLIRLVSRVKKELKKDLSISKFYENPTVLGMVSCLNEAKSINTVDNDRGFEPNGQILNLKKSVLSQLSDTLEIEDVYPMSDIQKGMVFTSLYNLEVGVYHDQLPRRIPMVEIPILEKALSLLVDKHAILRTRFNVEDFEEEVAIVRKNVPANIDYEDMSALTVVEQQSYIEKFLVEQRKQPFNVKIAPLWRIKVFKISEKEMLYILQIHHAILDGWSVSLLDAELYHTYGELIKNPLFVPKPLKHTYAEFAVQQYLSRCDGQVTEFWKNQMSDYKRLDIFKDEETYYSQKIYLDEKYNEKIKKYALKHDISSRAIFISAFSIVLKMLTYDRELTLGLVSHQRPLNDDGHKVLGCFLNTLPFRATFDDVNRITWADYVDRVYNKTLRILQMQSITLHEIAKICGETIKHRNPFFDVIFNYVDFRAYGELISSKDVKRSSGSNSGSDELDIPFFGLTNTFLDLSVDVTGDRICIASILRKEFKHELSLATLLKCFKEVLDRIVSKPENNVVLDTVLPVSIKNRLLGDAHFNEQIPFPKNETIVNIFNRQVGQTPDAIAITFGNEQISYADINKRINQLARFLIENGVTHNSFVGIILDRSVEMIVSILAILKSGAAYVPIDPKYPRERIDFIINDANLHIVISHSSLNELLSAGNDDLKILHLDSCEQQISKAKDEDLQLSLSGKDLAYVIYTSGTTGIPKGVLVSHENVVRLFKNDRSLFEFNQNDTWLLAHSYCFDVSVWELFGSLFHGSRLVIIKENQIKDPSLMAKIIVDEKITVLNQTPSAFQVLGKQILEIKPKLSLRYIIFAGEPLDPPSLQEWYGFYESCSLINMYGTTETTVHATYKKITEKEILNKTSNVGTPLPTLSFYVLDSFGSLLPKGVVGELYISGAGVARGYLNRPELTAERFVKNPWGTSHQKLYRTGDLVRWLPDDNFEYLGRVDKQVKIRGFRIELGEIEHTLRQMDEVQRCTVMALEEQKGNRQLAAYVQLKEKVDRQYIKSFLKKKLPSYMVPDLYVEVDSFSLTSSGKLNTKDLPSPYEHLSQIKRPYDAPVSTVEIKMANIWQDILKVNPIGINDDFFEMGGHSLSATRLVSAVRKNMEIELALTELFENPTIRELAHLIKNKKRGTFLPLISSVGERPERVPLSYAQERLWFIDKSQGSEQYNQRLVYGISGSIEISAIELAFRKIIQRHEILRSVYYEYDGVPYQKVLPAEGWRMGLEKIADDRTEDQIQKIIDRTILSPFNLSTDYMLRCKLIGRPDGTFTMVLVTHHIANDGWSLPILVKELAEFYHMYASGKTPNIDALSIQYADYAIWQRNYVNNVFLKNKLDYWEDKLKGVAKLMLPVDYPNHREEGRNRGAVGHYQIQGELRNQLKKLAREENVTLFMLLLAVFKVLLHKYSGQEDICIGTALANRTQTETENLIGFFVNSLAIRSNLKANESFREFLGSLRKTVLEAYDHQEVPFEDVVEKISNDRVFKRNPIFQVMFALQNNQSIEDVDIGLENVKLTPEQYGHTTSIFDITFNIYETNDGLSLRLEYRTDLFNTSTIQLLLNHYEKLLKSVVDNRLKSIAGLEMMDGNERNLVLDFGDNAQAETINRSINSLFEEQVLKSPNSMAISAGYETLTYKSLNEKSNRLAHHLIKKGVSKGDLIGICINRSPELIISIVAILKAGCAYVPLDPDYPKDRLCFITEDSALKLIVTNPKSRENFPENYGSGKIIFLDVENSVIQNESTKNVHSEVLVNDLAYVMYTSGSTGRPKGVMVEHGSVVNLSKQCNYVSLNSATKWLATGSISFDATTIEYWGTLLNGGELILTDTLSLLNTNKLKQIVNDHRINTIFITTSWFHQIVDEEIDAFKGLKYLLVGGDRINTELSNKVLETFPDLSFIHCYGPTENTTFSTTYSHTRYCLGELPIGKPLPNREAYIIDPSTCSNELQPIGAVGELSVGGEGLARGYLNRPELTNKKFVAHPTAKNRRMYLTGDKARWLKDGNIEFKGRFDNQIKLRGYRIELGEIESVVGDCEGVLSNCVLVKTNGMGEKRLVCYFALENDYLNSNELQFYEGQVRDWNDIYDEEFDNNEISEENREFDITGWMDSFTREPISKADMREWQADILATILNNNPKNVLEIGTGTGLIYFPLSKYIDSYTGYDFSETVVNQINKKIARREKKYPRTDIFLARADKIHASFDHQIDTIILNSIIQYFPGMRYLEKVIEKTIMTLQGSGKIIFGDVRMLELLPLFHKSLLLSRASDKLNIDSFIKRAEQAEIADTELCVSPTFFLDLKNKHEEINCVSLEWKKGEGENEMMCYRYNVVVHVGPTENVVDPEWDHWDNHERINSITTKMNDNAPLIAIKNVPNTRLWKEMGISSAVGDPKVKKVSDIHHFTREKRALKEQFENVLAHAKEKGYSIRRLLNQDPLKVDIVLERADQSAIIIQNGFKKPLSATLPQYTNFPLFEKISLHLESELKSFLVNKLPAYMIPDSFIGLRSLPLTANGKLDKSSLEGYDVVSRKGSSSYVAPKNETEHTLVLVWQDLLKVSPIGIHDNFFEIGGHSLLATRLQSAVRKELEVEISIKDIFEFNTIAELALYIDHLEGTEKTNDYEVVLKI